MDACSCVYVDVDDIETTLSSSMPTARTAHRCGECGGTISPGDTYERIVGVYDGHIETHKTCAVCREIRDAFFCGGWVWGCVREHMYEHIVEMDGEISESCLTEMSNAARAAVLDMIDEYLTERDDE